MNGLSRFFVSPLLCKQLGFSLAINVLKRLSAMLVPTSLNVFHFPRYHRLRLNLLRRKTISRGQNSEFHHNDFSNRSQRTRKGLKRWKTLKDFLPLLSYCDAQRKQANNGLVLEGKRKRKISGNYRALFLSCLARCLFPKTKRHRNKLMTTTPFQSHSNTFIFNQSRTKRRKFDDSNGGSDR